MSYRKEPTGMGTQQQLFGDTSDDQLFALAERIMAELDRRTNAVEPTNGNGKEAPTSEPEKKRKLRGSKPIHTYNTVRITQQQDGRYRAYWNISGMGGVHIIERHDLDTMKAVAWALDKAVAKLFENDEDDIRAHGKAMATVAQYLVPKLTNAK